MLSAISLMSSYSSAARRSPFPVASSSILASISICQARSHRTLRRTHPSLFSFLPRALETTVLMFLLLTMELDPQSSRACETHGPSRISNLASACNKKTAPNKAAPKLRGPFFSQLSEREGLLCAFAACDTVTASLSSSALFFPNRTHVAIPGS